MLTLLSSSLFLLSSLVSAGEGEAVFTLTADNFDEFISNNPKALVEFYAPWCGHCKALAPEYEKAAKQLKETDTPIVLAKVDATIEKDLASKYGVRGFPTLKYFTGDAENPSDYSGGRTADTIVSWLSVRALPAVSNLKTDEVESFKNKGKVVVIAYLDDESKETIISSVAESNRDSFVVGQVKSSDNKIDLFTSFNDKAIEFKITDDFSETTLLEFINGERFPLIDEIGPENYKDYVDRGLPLVWISVATGEEEKVEEVKKVLLDQAKAFKNKLSFVYVDNVKYAQHVGNLGITENPGLLIADEPKKYLLKGDLLDTDNVNKFFSDYSAGNLEPHLKSQEIPESNDEPVYVLVGKAFNDVIGQDKDVFVEYYAPWCGHCKRLAPEYEKVGEAFKDVDNVIIAKIDATENDTPEPIKGFPTLLWYPAGSSTSQKYEGGRSAEDIIAWIEEHASTTTETTEEGKTDL